MTKEEDKSTYLVLDLETTIRCPIGSNKASPFWKGVPNENEIAYEAVKLGNRKDGGVSTSVRGPRIVYGEPEDGYIGNNEVKLLVGHNLPFDVHHSLVSKWRVDSDFKMLVGANYWDTQLAEYLLSAQQNSYPSLDFVSKKYGLPVKDSKMKEYWNSGVDTPDIPEAEIVPYALQDVMNTEQVFLKQFEEVRDKGMLPLVKSQMAAIKMTTFMSYHGMYINKLVLWANKAELEKRKVLFETTLKAFISTTDYPECDYNSNKQLANLLFGGEIKYQEKELVGKYKNGKDKFQTVTKVRKVEGLGLKCEKEWISAAGNRSVDDEVLTELGHIRAVDCVLQLRNMNKQISTYYEGIENLIMPDGMIHQQLNHVVTKTGRLSCTQPNLQNITNGDIKQVFTSRFGEDGVIIDIDFSQLEIVALAFLSQDEQLIDDIQTGKDIHIELYKSMYGVVPTTEQRKAFKRLAFGLIYGAGATSLAKNAGVTVNTAKEFVAAFYSRYEGVLLWHDNMNAEVTKARKSSKLKDEKGYPIGVSEYVSCTGRRYLFKEYELKESMKSWKKKTHDFAPTEIKNYPVQGLATGDIVPLALGLLGKVLIGNEKLEGRCLPVNTVHDSIMFDCKREAVPEALYLICQVLDGLPEAIRGTFGINWTLNLAYNVSIGPSWAEVKELDKSALETIRLGGTPDF
jgi:DNA polymerase-1